MEFANFNRLWSLIEPLLPARAPRNRQFAGRKPTPDRAVLTGIVFVYATLAELAIFNNGRKMDGGGAGRPRRIARGSGAPEGLAEIVRRRRFR
ncbi:hypothetical protein [Paraburkholderia graminis]|uniref:Transposase n=1 Tax=Paraburkholderia graminis TaxID=60548 RepID=A0ABD5CJF7_9BURK|nr:hypothetical protein [Paraburkholderia graminis]MDR6204014.1 hypothetical protein [Paraburkholderia graminis]